MSSTNTIINPKPCNYNCGTRFIGIFKEMHTLKYFQKRNTYVLIGQIIIILQIKTIIISQNQIIIQITPILLLPIRNSSLIIIQSLNNQWLIL
jgi:hypothetical protein